MFKCAFLEHAAHRFALLGVMRRHLLLPVVGVPRMGKVVMSNSAVSQLAGIWQVVLHVFCPS